MFRFSFSVIQISRLPANSFPSSVLLCKQTRPSVAFHILAHSSTWEPQDQPKIGLADVCLSLFLVVAESAFALTSAALSRPVRALPLLSSQVCLHTTAHLSFFTTCFQNLLAFWTLSSFQLYLHSWPPLLYRLLQANCTPSNYRRPQCQQQIPNNTTRRPCYGLDASWQLEYGDNC